MKSLKEVRPLFIKIDKRLFQKLEIQRLKLGVSKTKFIEDILSEKLKDVSDVGQFKIKHIDKKKLAKDIVNFYYGFHKRYPSRRLISRFTGLSRQDVAHLVKTKVIKRAKYKWRGNWKIELAAAIPKGKSDEFADKLFEILSKENPKHMKKIYKDVHIAIEYVYKGFLTWYGGLKWLSKKERMKVRKEIREGLTPHIR